MNRRSRSWGVRPLIIGLCAVLGLQSASGADEKVEPRPPTQSEATGKAATPPAPADGKAKPTETTPTANGTKTPGPAEAKPKAPEVPPSNGGAKPANGASPDTKPKNGSKKNTSPEPASNSAAAPTLPTEIMGQDGATMLLVPAGEFSMGSADADDDERPIHRIHLDAFYIDKIEVTNARFARFAAAVMSEPPWGFANQDTPVKKGDQPVRWVNWIEATAYCAWVGKRLPTEAEWEKAARGTDNRVFPWGNDPPTPARAVFGLMDGAEPSPSTGARADGKSPYGVMDMSGNLYEWVADWYQEDYYAHSAAKNPKGPVQGSAKSQRGGSFTNAAYRLRGSFRTKGEPTEHHPRVGFRCAQDAPRTDSKPAP